MIVGPGGAPAVLADHVCTDPDTVDAPQRFAKALHEQNGIALAQRTTPGQHELRPGQRQALPLGESG